MKTNEGLLILGILATSYLLLFDCAQSTALALASSPNREAPFDPARIDRLLPDIRRAALRMCRKRPTAAEHFVTYLDNSMIVRLHFEHFYCEGRPGLCRSATNCLHQEFVASGSGYRLVRSYYGRPHHD
jgi:hypothetical protein